MALRVALPAHSLRKFTLERLGSASIQSPVGALDAQSAARAVAATRVCVARAAPWLQPTLVAQNLKIELTGTMDAESLTKIQHFKTPE